MCLAESMVGKTQFHVCVFAGELHVPLDVCGAVVKRELDYWQIDQNLIEACCWTSYSQFIGNIYNTQCTSRLTSLLAIIDKYGFPISE